MSGPTDIGAAQRVAVTIDGVVVAFVGAYRTSCVTANMCTVRVGGAAGPPRDLDAWFAAAQAGEASARKNFAITVFDATGAPIRRFQVANGTRAR